MALRGVCVVGVVAGFLAGCDDQGFSRVGDEWGRRNAGPYYVVSAAHDRAVVSARGRQVAIEPAKGFCLASESVEASRLSAFALIGDCALDKPTDGAPRGARGELQLPRSLPGIITVSVSGDPGIVGDPSGDALEGLTRFIETPEGRKLLGRGGPGSDVTVLESRRIDNGVYVRVDDGTSGVVPVLDPEFWRAFVEVNDRLAVVTVSGFKDRPVGKEQMLKHLVRQVERLELANARPINEPGVLVASAERSGAEPRAQTLSDVRADSVLVVSAQNQPEPESAAPLEQPTEAEEAALEALLASTTTEEGGVGSDIAETDETTAAPYESALPMRAARAGPSDDTPVEATATAGLPQEEPAAVTAALPTPEPAAPPAIEASDTPGSTVPLPRPGGAPSGAPAEADADEAPELAPTKYAPQSSPKAPPRPRKV